MASKRHESLDTNVILRMMINDIPEQRERARQLLRCPDVEYHLSDLTITEAVYVLQDIGRERREIVGMLRGLFKPLNINANFNLFERVFPMYLAHPKLSFNDCCLAAYAELNGAEPLWTFDQKLANQVKNAELVG